MTRTTRSFFGRAATAGLAALAALAAGAAPAQTKEPIAIGVIANLTGTDVKSSTAMVRGVELAAEAVNAAGGADGHPIKLIVEDSQYKTQEALNAATKLFDVDKVPAVIMFGGSSLELAVAPIAKAKGKLLINTSSSSPKLGEFPGTLYSILPLDDIVGKALGAWVATQSVKSVAFVVPNNTFGIGLMDASAAAFEAAGGKVLTKIVYSEGQPDYRTDLQQLLARQPDAIITAGYGDDSRTVFKAARGLGLKQSWYAAYPSILTVENEAWMNGRLLGVDDGGLTGATAAKVAAAYKAKHDDGEPTPHVFYGYDALMLIAKAAAMPAGLGPTSLEAAVKGYDGATGPIVWNANGQRIDPPIDIIAYKDGKFATIGHQ
ncbi:ABC transporter substrate-binding protein [Labrys wisconsinensis]|uniref:Branched-chain amino acid transport system substrate-binding protein n=1 Tax=Labrys wisconsinensis TaxID=425677 RepID=A0ABU0J921_9HYPH|nr:ABC transporter substrate-binding protein [Labrys wisconsinensis]MDQ0470768.1 branched-chain amino acid transport system substrate-binding protein [Labrys wisconsinensis]